jgi:hypothetical protein
MAGMLDELNRREMRLAIDMVLSPDYAVFAARQPSPLMSFVMFRTNF